ncbi:MAG: matrixin family metalloprotease [Candidatus Marinimicrobia bacterium]|nr:matrixin family metalloprotease [Candidatus Neomarinimicrobiota bacterium]
MSDRIITIIPIGEIDNSFLDFISWSIEETFRITTALLPNYNLSAEIPPPLPGNRYNSTSILQYLSDKKFDNTLRLLAITESDLYSPIFSTLYGEAQLNGRCALVSLHRLRQEYYNLPPDQTIFLSRFHKVVIHEIAHTFGLIHCIDKNCIMYPSSNVIDIDEKSSLFCPSCNQKLLLIN